MSTGYQAQLRPMDAMPSPSRVTACRWDNDGDTVMLVQGNTARHAASHNRKRAGNGAVVKMGGKYRPSHQTRHHGEGGICSPNDNSILAIAGGPRCVVMVLLSGLKGRAGRRRVATSP
jgi:hypothetical protein